MEKSDSDIKQTQYNSNFHRIISLNTLLDDCNYYSRLAYTEGYNTEALKQWRNTLLSVWKEISTKIGPDETKRIKELFKVGYGIGSVHQYRNTEEGKVKFIDMKKFNKHWQLLQRTESMLRLYADKRGMLMTNKEEEDFLEPEEKW